MIVDAASIEPNTAVRAEVCIIGAGAAGITIARSLGEAGASVVVLEGGHDKFRAASQSLYAGECVGAPYELESTRSRMLGGSTNCWGGFSVPLEPEKLAGRHWVPDSDWPIGGDILAEFYPSALNTLGLDVSLNSLDPAKGNKKGSSGETFVLDGTSLENKVAQVVTRKRRFRKAFRHFIWSDRKVRFLLGANVVGIRLDPTGAQVQRVEVRTFAGRTLWAHAKTYVLAAGGIENPRLLLLSDDVHRSGLGNGFGVVGRYFAEHATVSAGRLTLNPRLRSSMRLYDTAFATNRLSTSVYMQLKFEVQRAERITHVAATIENFAAGEEASGVEALKKLYLELKGGLYSGKSAKHLLDMAKDMRNVMYFLGYHLLGSERYITGRDLVLMLEQEPNPESRIMLAKDRDALGLRKVCLDWRFTDADRRTIRRSLEIFAEGFRASGIGTIAPYEGVLDGSWSQRPRWVWHHMGATRMGTDARRSVVDPNLKVHGVHNLFVVGSSVFPSSPGHTPTVTVVALAIRLAEHLKGIHALRPGLLRPRETLCRTQ